jgi:hypothetical protein
MDYNVAISMIAFFFVDRNDVRYALDREKTKIVSEAAVPARRLSRVARARGGLCLVRATRIRRMQLTVLRVRRLRLSSCGSRACPSSLM